MNKDNIFITEDDFEIHLNEPNRPYFMVDEAMSETIALLNKKGYHTNYSCAGHFEVIEFFEPIDETMVDEYKNDPKFQIVEKDGLLAAKTYNEGSNCYITFDKEYDFDELPEGFKYQDAKITAMVLYFTNDGILKSEKTINAEFALLNKNLLEWSKKLPTLQVTI